MPINKKSKYFLFILNIKELHLNRFSLAKIFADNWGFCPDVGYITHRIN